MIRAAMVLLSVFTVLTGIAYPLALTLVARHGLARGAVGRVFDGPDVFWSRPTVGTPLASSGSNLGPTNPAFLDAVRERVRVLRQAHPEHLGPVPADLVTTSGSGLDPHLSLAAVTFQVERVARARGLSSERLQHHVRGFIEPRFLGIFGEERINVVLLNDSLAALRP